MKFILLFSLFLLNQSESYFLLKFLTILDAVCDIEIFACSYPLISIVHKSDKAYATNDLVFQYSAFIGIFFSAFFLGKMIWNFEFDYNFYILIAAVLICGAFIYLQTIYLQPYYKCEKKYENHDLMFQLLKKVRNDKISKIYLLFTFFGETAYACVTDLALIILTSYFSYSPKFSSNFLLVLELASLVFGTLILSKFTSKNDYFNISVKYVGRLLFFLLAIIFGTKLFFLLAIIYVQLTSNSYSHVTDAPYINRISSEYQLSFNNLSEMVVYFGAALGAFLCGLVFNISLRYVFLIAAIFILGQILFGFYAIKLRKSEII